MVSEVVAGKWAEVRSPVASKGLSLSTTAARAVLPRGTDFVSVIGTTYSTAVVARFQFNPWLTVLKTTDSAATFTDYSIEAQDGSTSTSITLSSLDTLANGDALYVGSHLPFAGVHIDVDGTNGSASITLDVDYWDGSEWASTSSTDGTASGGTTLAQDGSVTWTVPSDWVAGGLGKILTAEAVASEDPLPALTSGVDNTALYWTRWSVDGALDSSVTLDHMLSINRSTAYIELPTGLPWDQGVATGPGGISHIEAVTDAGTALLIVNCAASKSFL